MSTDGKMMTVGRLESNLWKIELNAFLINFFVYAPILFIAFQQKGMSFAQIGIIMAIGSLSFLFEVPFGVLSDRWSRKGVLALAGLAGAFSTLLWLGDVFWIVALGMLFRGMMNALISGTDTALLYDTLKDLGRESEYAKYNARRFSTGLGSLAIAAFLASLLPGFPYTAHFLLTTAAFLAAMLIGFSMAEPALHRKNEPRTMLKHVGDAWRIAKEHREIRKLVLYSMAVSPTLIIVFMYFQFFFSEAGVSPERFGFIYASLVVISFLAGRMAHRVQGALGKPGLLAAMPVALAAAILFLIVGELALVVYLAYAIVEVLFGIQGSVVNNYMQEHLTAEYRASVESLRAVAGNIYSIVMVSVLGLLADAGGLSLAFALLLVVFLFLVVPPTYFLVREAKA